MAYVIPSPWEIAKPASGSNSEKSLYDALANDEYSTKRGWYVIYSYRGDGRRDEHPSQDEYQIDFLLLIPGKGVVILEDKPTFSPPERLSDDLWRFGSYTDRNPYTKQHANRRAVSSLLTGTPFSNMPVHTMVVWPNLTRGNHDSLAAIESEAADHCSQDQDYFPHQTLCGEDLPRIGEVIDQRLREWAEWWRSDPARSKRQYYKLKYLAESRPKRDEVAGELRRIFSPSGTGLHTDHRALRELHSRILERLTEDQLKAQNCVLSARQGFVLGPPGSGKTILALEAARAHARVRPQGKVLFACFRDELAVSIRSRLEAVAAEGEVLPVVMSVRDLCVAALGSDGVDRFGANWERAIPEAALAIIDGAAPSAEVLVLDEAQQLLLASDQTVDRTLYPNDSVQEDPNDILVDFESDDPADWGSSVAIGPSHIRRGEKLSDSLRVLFDAVLEGGLRGGHWLMYGDPTQDEAFTLDYSVRLSERQGIWSELQEVNALLRDGGRSTTNFGLGQIGDGQDPDDLYHYVESVDFEPLSPEETLQLQAERDKLVEEEQALQSQGGKTAREWLMEGLRRTDLDSDAVQVATLTRNIRNPEGLYAYAKRLVSYGDLKIDHGQVEAMFSGRLPETRYADGEGIETLFEDSVRAWTWAGEGCYSDDEWDVAPDAAVSSLANLLHELTILEPYEPGDIAVVSVANDRNQRDHDVAARLASDSSYRLAPFASRDSSHIGYGRIEEFLGLESRIVIITDFMNVWQSYDPDWDVRAWACHRAYVALTRTTERAYLLLPEEVHYALYYDLFGWPEDVGHYKAVADGCREYFRPLEGLEGMFPRRLAQLALEPRPATNHVSNLGQLRR